MNTALYDRWILLLTFLSWLWLKILTHSLLSSYIFVSFINSGVLAFICHFLFPAPVCFSSQVQKRATVIFKPVDKPGPPEYKPSISKLSMCMPRPCYCITVSFPPVADRAALNLVPFFFFSALCPAAPTVNYGEVCRDFEWMLFGSRSSRCDNRRWLTVHLLLHVRRVRTFLAMDLSSGWCFNLLRFYHAMTNRPSRRPFETPKPTYRHEFGRRCASTRRRLETDLRSACFRCCQLLATD